MRLPFGLGRRSSSGDGASDGGSDAGSVAAPAASGAPSRAWASLPAIQRTTGDMPLVAAPGRFAEALSGSHALPPIVQPLGHQVSALATPGLIVARVRPVETATAGSIPAPVQRRAARSSSRPAAAVPFAPTEPDVAEHVTHEAPVAAMTTPPVRSMPTVSRLAIRMPDRPLTSAASAARPAAVQRAAAAAAAAAAGSPALPLPSSGGMRRVPSAPATPPTLSREATAALAAATPTAPSSSASAGSPTRHGLGEPMTTIPASARPVSSAAQAPVVSRSTTSGPMPISASGLRSAVQRSAAPATGASPLPALAAGSPVPASAFSSSAGLPALPRLPVARSTSSTSAASTPSPTTASVAVASPAPEIRPIAGANPIRPSIALQRSEADEDGDEHDDAALPSPWWAPASETPAKHAFGAHAGSDGPATSLQRSRADGAAAAGSTSSFAGGGRPAAQVPSPSSGGAPVQRRAGTQARPALPGLSLAHDGGHRGPGASGAPADAVQPSIAFPSRTLGGDPVVQTSAQRTGSSPSAGQLPGSSGPAVVQRTEEVAPTSPTPVAPAGQASPSRSERDLDELAQALFGRIRGRLRNDLIYDREAKGLTFDNV